MVCGTQLHESTEDVLSHCLVMANNNCSHTFTTVICDLSSKRRHRCKVLQRHTLIFVASAAMCLRVGIVYGVCPRHPHPRHGIVVVTVLVRVAPLLSRQRYLVHVCTSLSLLPPAAVVRIRRRIPGACSSSFKCKEVRPSNFRRGIRGIRVMVFWALVDLSCGKNFTL